MVQRSHLFSKIEVRIAPRLHLPCHSIGLLLQVLKREIVVIHQWRLLLLIVVAGLTLKVVSGLIRPLSFENILIDIIGIVPANTCV